MTGKGNFPEFRDIAEARCFSCDAPLIPATVEPSGLPAGDGAHSAACSACDMRTWFDLGDRR